MEEMKEFRKIVGNLRSLAKDRSRIAEVNILGMMAEDLHMERRKSLNGYS